MAINKTQVRAELQFTEEVVSDDAIDYVINKVDDDLNLVCAEILRLLLRRHRGVVRRSIGKFSEVVDPMELRSQINMYMNRAATTVFDDGEEFPDAMFTREGV